MPYWSSRELAVPDMEVAAKNAKDREEKNLGTFVRRLLVAKIFIIFGCGGTGFK